MPEKPDPTDYTPPKTLIVPSRPLRPLAGFGWLMAGWVDFCKAKKVSLLYGIFVFLVSALVAWFAWELGGYVLLFSALSGFVFVAPMLAFGLYSVSRQLCEGRTPNLSSTFRAIKRPLGNSLTFTIVLLVIFLLWVRAGMMVQVFFPMGGTPEWDHILTFLAIGSSVGAIFATFSFMASVFSLPMLANRDIDVITAVISSINGALRNKVAMLVWAFLICSLTLVGFLTAGVGLIVIIPWLAYATWHGYRAALDPSGLPILPCQNGQQNQEP
jgi:uncharacterized membrane protein